MNSIYSLFRSLIGDVTYGDYKVPDANAFTFLDKAIDKLSSVHENILIEDKTVTDEDITNGYFTLQNDIVQVLDGLYGEGRLWRYGRNNRITLIRDFKAGDYTIRYRAKYKKFDGQLRDDNYFDFDQDADLPVVLYAVALWLQTQGMQKLDGTGGVVSSKSEENQRIDYAVNGELISASSPESLMEQAVDMMLNMPNAQSAMFSVRN